MNIQAKYKRYLIYPLIIVLIFFLFSSLALRRNPTKKELCNILQEQLRETQCRNLPNRLSVLKSAFPPNTAREDIQALLLNFHQSSTETEFGSLEYYDIGSSWADRNGYTFAYPVFIFDFDVNDKLISIREVE
jgi:hypothetical protein